MHQLGLIRALRAALVLSAAMLGAAQLLTVLATTEAQSAAVVPGMALPLEGIGAVGFDGAPSRDHGALAAAWSSADAATR